VWSGAKHRDVGEPLADGQARAPERPKSRRRPLLDNPITALREQALQHVESGDFAAELSTMVGYRTVSSDPDQTPAVRTYLGELLRPTAESTVLTAALFDAIAHKSALQAD
jgi:hypothetical protein